MNKYLVVHIASGLVIGGVVADNAWAALIRSNIFGDMMEYTVLTV